MAGSAGVQLSTIQQPKIIRKETMDNFFRTEFLVIQLSVSQIKIQRTYNVIYKTSAHKAAIHITQNLSTKHFQSPLR
jgi:hypothetical protein